MKKTQLAAVSAILLLAFNLGAENNNSELITVDKTYSASSCLIYNPNIGIIVKDKNISVEADSLQFDDNQAISLNNNVKIDFPGGLLNSSNALIGASKELIEFKENTTLSLDQVLLKGNQGFFNRSNDLLFFSKMLRCFFNCSIAYILFLILDAVNIYCY